ncbi:MAG TPA: hypothetical protein VNG71_21345 [Pyrinomonadaceae bacterium]|nr:hypothetical protein [Pyrinomonadaceae bacterium]
MAEDSEKGAGVRTSQSAATDFLTSLLDRALDRAPVLERRRPALFEPPRTMIPLDKTLLEQTIEEKALEQDSPGQTFGRSPAVVSSPAAPPAHTETIRPDTRLSQPARSVAPLSIETERKTAVNSDRAYQSSPVDNRLTPGAREEKTAPSATRAESASAQNLPTAPLLVSERIIERQVEIHDSIREHQLAEDDGPTPGRDLSPASPITTVMAHRLNRERDNKTTTTSPTNRKPEPRMSVEAIRAEEKKPPAIVAPQTFITRLASPVTQVQPIAEKKLAAPAQKIEPRITIEPRRAKPEAVPPIKSQRTPTAVAKTAGSQNSSAADPTIRVTIGRVEVRATLASSQPRVTRPPAPKLSLDDYLRSRGGEGT